MDLIENIFYRKIFCWAPTITSCGSFKWFAHVYEVNEIKRDENFKFYSNSYFVTEKEFLILKIKNPNIRSFAEV